MDFSRIMKSKTFLHLITIGIGACCIGLSSAEPSTTPPDAAEKTYLEARAIVSSSGDMARARTLFEQAAQAGNMKARGVLGYMQLTGSGGAKDEAAALANLKAASDAGIASAMVNLASMHEKGLGVPVSLPLALSFYQKAATAGSVEGRKRAIDILYFGRDDVKPDYEKALPLIQAAASDGEPHACNLLGIMHEFGQGVDTDLPKAIQWFRTAATKGDLKAQCNFGRLLRQTSTSPSDLLEAYRWIRLSAERGEITAKVILIDFEKGFTDAQKADVGSWIAKFPASPDGSPADADSSSR